MKAKKQPFKPVTYRVAGDRVGNSLIIKAGRRGNVYVFDENKGFNRAIRHCPNERSIFVDEQSPMAVTTPVVFEHGYFEITRPDQLITKQFLDAHPKNKANGGRFFEIVDEQKEDQAYIEVEEIKVELKSLVNSKSKEEDGLYALQATVSALEGRAIVGDEMLLSELKAKLYSAIDEDYELFVDEKGNPTIFEDSHVNMSYVVLRAKKEGVIKTDDISRTVSWAKGGEQIFKGPIGVPIMDSFVDFLFTEEGLLVAKEISKRSS